MDLLLALAVFTASALGAPPSARRDGLSLPEPRWETLAPLALACVLLLLRRDRPRLVWGLVLGLSVVPAVFDLPGYGLPAVGVAVYTVASRTTRRWAVLAGAASASVGILALLASTSGTLADPLTTVALPWSVMAAALGDTVREHRRSLADATERARVAETTKEEEARRRVVEERLHLSREIHDVVGHHLAVINVQSGVAEHLLERDPRAATEAMRHVREATAQALGQTSRLVSMLRDHEPVTQGPGPGMEATPDLVDSARTAGADVRWTHHGPPLHLGEATDLHGYRILQEALTNAVRHGAGDVTLTTRQDPDHVRLTVTNTLPTARGATPVEEGNGLVGMRERVALCDGRLDLAVTEREFTVTVTLPVADTLPEAGS